MLIDLYVFHQYHFILIDRYKANVFSSKRERTYDMLLQDIYEKYIVDEHSLEHHSSSFAGSTSINKLYGNNRKHKDQKVLTKHISIYSITNYVYFWTYYVYSYEIVK